MVKSKKGGATDDPLVSVVIPSYNRGKVLRRAIDSVLKQSYENIECIVVDDNSDDNTEDIVNSYKDKRLRYVKLNKNLGACIARNIGVREAKGEYVAFQDSDDEWRKNKLEVQMKNMRDTGSDLNFCNILIHDGGERVVLDDKRISLVERKGVLKNLLDGNFISTQAIVGKRNCFENIKFDERLPRLQDYDLVLRLSTKYKWSISKDVGVDLYVQGDSISRNYGKLEKATEMMLLKDYGLSRTDKNTLDATLLKTLGDVNFYENLDLAKKYYRRALAYRRGDVRGSVKNCWADNIIVDVFVALRGVKNRLRHSRGAA